MLLVLSGQAVVDRRQDVSAERVAGQDETFRAPLLAVVLHQLGEVGGALFRALVLPVVAQGVDADHRVAHAGHMLGRVLVQVAPAAVAGIEQGDDVRGFRRGDLEYRQGLGVALQLQAQLMGEHVGQRGVVVADAGFRARLLADEDCGVVVRVVVPGQQPLAVRRLVRQRGVAVALGQGNVEADRERLGLVVVLAGEPAPGGGRAWADAGDQVRLAAEAGNDRFEPGLLRPAIAVFRGEVLDHPGGAVVSQVQHLGVVQLLFGGGDHHHPRARLLAGFGKGGVAAVVEVQGFQFRLGRRSAPEQQGGTDDQHQGGDQKTAPVTFHDRHISVSPIQSGRRRSARRYRPGPLAGRARLARPGSGVPSRAGTCP